MHFIKTLAVTTGIVFAAGAHAKLPSAVTFDGYCDGFSNIQYVHNGRVIGDYDLTNCNGYGQLVPSVGHAADVDDIGGKSVGIQYAGQGFDATGWAPLMRLNSDRTVTVYFDDGHVLHTTWTDASEANARGNLPALAPR